MIYFFDTSALIKIYHYEKGSDDILKLYDSDSIIAITELSRIELLSGLHRKYREKIIDDEILDILIKKINFDIEIRFTMLCFSSAVIETATDIVLEYNRDKFLRTLDILQLSFFKLYCEKDDIFVCFDARLNGILNEKKYNLYTP